MNEKFTSNDIGNDTFNLNNKESDFKNLINRLKGIRATIASLEKRYLDKV